MSLDNPERFFPSKPTTLILHIVPIPTTGEEIKSNQNVKEHRIRFFRSVQYWANENFIINFPGNKIRSNTNTSEYL